MREVRDLARIVVGVVRALVWLVATIWLGGRAIWRAADLLRRWRLVHSDRLSCPRGHEVVLLGTWRCGCGAAFDGYVFAKCPVCHRTAGWVPCARCQLPVRNPALD